MAETEEPGLPREPIHRLVGPLERFLYVEAASGVVLLLCAITALVLANSGLALDGEALDAAKLGVIGGSALAGVLGMGLLLWLLPSGTRE